jgi:hypothetical protein
VGVLHFLLSTVESDFTLRVASCVETVWSLDRGDAELVRDGTVVEGLSGDEPNCTGVMLQESDVRCDVEEKLCDHSN